MSQFSRYLPIVSQLAQRALAQTHDASDATSKRDAEPGRIAPEALCEDGADLSVAPQPKQTKAGPPVDSIAFASPSARLLLGDDPLQYTGLVAGWKRLAALGRPWAAVGITLGMTDVPTTPQSAPARPPTEFPRLEDGAGHSRDVYHPFVLHLHLAAFLARYETMPVGVWSGCEDALPEAVAPTRWIESWADAAPPTHLAASVLWQALCLLEQAEATGRDTDVELVDAVVHRVLDRPGPDGALQPFEFDESPDAWTYRELCGLHGLANLALRRRNRQWSRRVQEAAEYHVAHTQPDHVTTQPWGLFAFLWSGSTQVMAEQQLHDLSAQGAGAGVADLVTAYLLADAADAMARFEA